MTRDRDDAAALRGLIGCARAGYAQARAARAAFVLVARGLDVTMLADRLTPDERARADRFRLDADRANYATARALVRALLRPGEPSVPFAAGAAGKPFLPGAAAFNISHSRDLVALAIAPTPGAAIGVDLERNGRDWPVDDLIDRVCHPRERAHLALLTGDVRRGAFLTCWTRKEAALKAVGSGLVDDLPAINTQLAAERPLLALPCRLRIWSIPPPAPGWHCALALWPEVASVFVLLPGVPADAPVMLSRLRP